MAAATQIRNMHSHGRACFDRKLAGEEPLAILMAGVYRGWRAKDLQLRGLLTLVTVGALRYGGTMGYPDWRRADRSSTGPRRAGAAGRC